MSSKNIYYVYQYYDPIRKEPIYIGKGKDQRAYSHLKIKNKKHPLKHRILWIRKYNKEPIIKILKNNLTEKQALKLEKQYIKQIGRKDLKLGTLLNLTDGGEGLSNSTKHWSKTGTYKPPSGKHHHLFGKHHSEKSKENNRQKHLGKIPSKETRIKMSKASKGRIPWIKGKNHSHKTKLQIKLKMQGGNNPAAKIIKINGIIYLSIKDYAKTINKPYSTICQQLRKP